MNSTIKQAAAAKLFRITRAIVETVAEIPGSPGGSLFMAMNMAGMSHATFTAIMSSLVEVGYLRVSNHQYFATDAGLDWIAGEQKDYCSRV